MLSFRRGGVIIVDLHEGRGVEKIEVRPYAGATLWISESVGPNDPPWIDLVRSRGRRTSSGSAGLGRSGVRRATFVVPGGRPDGTYFIQAALQDTAHMESWVSNDSGWTTDNHALTDAPARTGTHFVVANSG